MAFRPSTRANAARVSDTSQVDFKAFFTNTELKGQTTIQNVNCDNFNITNSLRINDGAEIYNGDERNFYNKTERKKFELTDIEQSYPLLGFENTLFNSSMYLVVLNREDGKFDENDNPYLAFYLLKGIDGKILPPIILIQKQIDSFSFADEENDILNIKYNCGTGFDVLLTITQIS